jgi:lipoate-protein ligase B
VADSADAASQSGTLTLVRLGRLAYEPALQAQLAAVERVKTAREGSAAEEFLLLVEHDPPVLTIGRGGGADNLLASREALAARGFELYESSRGGDVTYHGPGQLVAYPVIDLNRHGRDVHRYLRDIEQVVIDLLQHYGIDGRRDPEYTGVWVGQEKVCAIGVAITRWVTYHGLALNVTTDLSHFDLIVPCGIADRGVTSLSQLLERHAAMDEVTDVLVKAFCGVFDFSSLAELPASELAVDG